MSRRVVVLVGAWIVSLVGVGAWVQAGQGAAPIVPSPAIISGADIGFQPVSGQAGEGKKLGKLMVRIDGKWYEIQAPAQLVR